MSSDDQSDAPKKRKKRRSKKGSKTSGSKKTSRSRSKKGASKRRSKKAGAPKDAPASSKPNEGSGAGRPWWAVILLLGAIELYLFGSRGALEVCVAREGEHDFALLDQDRTPENTKHFPTCETRLNVGLLSRFDEAQEEAMLLACRRATVFQGRDATLRCALQDDGWSHRLTASTIPPWDPRYYRRLFWFAF